MINYYYKTINDQDLKKTKRFKSGSWIYVFDPTEKELKFLEENHLLERGHLTDALDKYEVPRIETENDDTYIFTRYPLETNNKGEIITVPLLIVAGRNFVLTVSPENLDLNDKLFKQNNNFSTTQKTKLILHILSEINHTYNKFINEISREIRKTSIGLKNTDVKNKDIIKLVANEMTLNDFLSSLLPIKNNMEILTSGKTLRLFENDKDLIEDLHLSSNQLVEISKSNLKNIVNIREASNTIMSNNLNKTIKFLTALTVVLNVPVLISSIYGMNVPLPLTGSVFAFWYVISLAFFVSLTLTAIFIKKDWF
ncbi:MAG: Mg2 transporter protein CorA family protein [Candidatus Woesebacteria bacterium GW2011_GWB1_38_5]|uniref:Mg2 transporter protein CorA family protein n=5 Tax=Candidatus Woeseibacteriota TaxID=1752722 RepID=A0A0G0KVV0_9BACT|nr:MAG: Mg2 transporter protein CorA family protein [Candidatus Woesebacteria bacterium GW2011_GWC1_38_13]KKQ74020.1 MAG: Mg2 transporter protein CorA family protein [Candidatus Woesebacteria bacterium GW2011_GWB1_38_5]KKQ83823.1 MAG: Mg2 transporter protein CorA family protein [Candidatus Woesebacteria bacterium GW2011_GWA1_38_8]